MRHVDILDILVKKQDTFLSTTVYRKPTATDRLLDYGSNHPSCHKKSVVKTLYRRAAILCSNEADFKREKTNLKNIFKKNNYPLRRFAEWTSPTQRETESEDPNFFISAPYIPRVSETAARILKRGNVFLAHSPSNTLRRQLMKIKDKRSKEDTSGVVYSIPCKDCHLSYVGETGRKLGIRLSEHERDLRLKNNPRSHVFQHQRDTGHSMDLDATQILYHAKNTEKRMFLESWATNANSLNRAKELNDAYVALRNQ